MPLYAAYGSNMDPELMFNRAPHSPLYATGWLEGWRLTFAGEDIGWEGALSTVVEDPHSRVFVVLYDMTEEDEKNLDRWEGTELGIYRKLRVGVQLADEHKVAWLYVLDDFEGGLPSEGYLNVITQAAEKAGAPAEYVQDLISRESRKQEL